ncbi:unnamed protein product [Diamesa tonsa]
MGSVKGFFSKPIFLIILACIIPNLGGFLGSLFTNDSLQTWFKTLIKPSFNPPGWIFGPVWTMLYLLMGYASYRVWRIGGGFAGEARLALIFFIIQLLLNWAWPPIFFKFHLIGVAAIEIVVLLIVVLITSQLFYQIDVTSSILYIPYIAWLSFATFLNYRIWTLN